jgi:hypothetical protein
MTAHDWFVEHRTDFAIRALEPAEEATFHEHLAGCEECRRETARIERELAWLPMGAAPVAPRPGLTRELVERAIGRRPGASRWLVPLALAASLVAVAGAWGWATVRVRAAEQGRAAVEARLAYQLAMTRDTLGIIQAASKVRHASISMGGHEGGMLIFADERSHRWNVVVYGLPAPHAGQICQFWFITETGMVRGVVVPTDDRAPAFLTLPMPPGTSPVMGAALTMEAAGSSGAAPLGTELAHLML